MFRCGTRCEVRSLYSTERSDVTAQTGVPVMSRYPGETSQSQLSSLPFSPQNGQTVLLRGGNHGGRPQAVHQSQHGRPVLVSSDDDDDDDDDDDEQVRDRQADPAGDGAQPGCLPLHPLLPGQVQLRSQPRHSRYDDFDYQPTHHISFIISHYDTTDDGSKFF